jgi:1-acyl-sn-glycerol-3-phosphate acyltransferase
MKPLYKVSWNVARFLLRLLWGFRVEGEDRIPREGGMIVAFNHASYADPVVGGLGVPRELHFYAKRELFRNRAFGALIAAYNAVPVRRGAVERETLQRVSAILRSGGALLVFPEGTRSRDGAIGGARPGVGMIASLAGVPIVPGYIRGTRSMGRSLFHRGRLSVFFADPIDPGAVRGESRKERYRQVGERVVESLRLLQAKYG